MPADESAGSADGSVLKHAPIARFSGLSFDEPDALAFGSKDATAHLKALILVFKRKYGHREQSGVVETVSGVGSMRASFSDVFRDNGVWFIQPQKNSEDWRRNNCKTPTATAACTSRALSLRFEESLVRKEEIICLGGSRPSSQKKRTGTWPIAWS